MYKLLLVDDERHVVDWLEKIFIESGFEIYKAYSGREALLIMEQYGADIILSDIKMPGISGFELAERVFSSWPNSRIIFLSGYSDFDYVYRANRKNVKFILKTEDDDVIIDEVLKERNAMAHEWQVPINHSNAKCTNIEDHNILAKRISQFIAEHIGEDLSLARIAYSVSYNPSYISRVYKQLTGENISDCVKRKRIEYAAEKLIGTEWTVQEIAKRAGFDSPQYFATVFRSSTGYSPLKYRKLRKR